MLGHLLGRHQRAVALDLEGLAVREHKEVAGWLRRQPRAHVRIVAEQVAHLLDRAVLGNLADEPRADVNIEKGDRQIIFGRRQSSGTEGSKSLTTLRSMALTLLALLGVRR